MKDDWDMEIVTPLFYGKLDFIDLVYKEEIEVVPGSQVNYLQIQNDSVIVIPENLIYDPRAFIDSFNFLIEGDDYLSYLRFDYHVSNGCPLPFRIGIRFFEKNHPGSKGPLILPPAFSSGEITEEGVVPVSDFQQHVFTYEELSSFKKANRIEFIAWFERSPGIKSGDTLQARYPVEITISLSGVVEDQYE